MIFSNKVLNRVHLCLALLLIIVCAVLAFRVNRRFPAAKTVTNVSGDTVEWLGCQIRALDCQVYPMEEYRTAHPEDMQYSMNTAVNPGSGVVWFQVEVTNKNAYEVKFSLTRQAVAAAFPSAWNNGIPPLRGHGILKPGETRVMEGSAYYAPSLYHFTEAKDFPNNDFQLIFSFYPERVVLHF